MRIRLLAALAGLGLLLAACEPTVRDPDDDELLDTPEDAEDPPEEDDPELLPDDDIEEPNDVGEPDDEVADAPRLELGEPCTNAEDGYRLRYPQAWHANTGEATAACRVFDVEPPEADPDTVLPLDAAVLLTLEDHRFDGTWERVEADPATDVETITEDEIAGRALLRVDGTATGEAYLGEDVEVHRTYVEFDGRTLRVEANALVFDRPV